ncbi:MAG: DNA polymerase I [Alphaproteobacteria bacterium MarineAlpha5_Bin5]|nr:MAG: DNA polymerase I [Alphaproteobacteria bacterium MarineAlpha5_Bin5]PPR52360.1 MAG: DNA polymerase I [Alphaproteobacteria bacterium MarineAlpha5_Bin4]|tara:strand:+ start:1358 stop:4102 length:2745 start_codon:yes stop_codon:yes gene_type:complete
MNKQNRLILIDGSAYIFRAYYGLPPMSRADGTPINAVFGFTNMLVKLIEDYRDDKMIVVFDAARFNFRNEIYKEYKANRGETPEDLIPQFDIIRKCVDAFKITQLEIEGYEADDIIASYTKLATKKKINSLIISSDKDLMQLVDENVSMLDPMKNKIIGIDQVIEKFGLPPDKVIFIQALTGDKIDNIPGAPGIGPKTALELIKNYGDIDGLIKNVDKIKQEKRRRTIADSIKDILTSLELVKLKKDIDLPIQIEEIQTYSSIENNNTSISNFLDDQGFKSIAQRLKNNANVFSNIEEEKTTSTEKYKYVLVNSKKNFEDLLNNIRKMGYCAIDTETNSLNIEKVKLVGISLCCDEYIAYYIPINHVDKITSKRIKEQLEEDYVLKKIKNICEDPSIIKIGQNIKFDIRVFAKYNILIKSIADTMLMSYSLDNGITKHNMDDLAFNHLQHNCIQFKDMVGSGKSEITFDYVDINNAVNYAAEDALVTLKLYNLLFPRVVKEKTCFIYEEIDLHLIEVLSLMENNGIKVNINYLKELSNQFEKDSNNIAKKIFKFSKKEFNIGSPKQLGEILFLDLKIEGAKKTKSGTFSTDSSTLQDLESKGYEIAKLVLEWREVTKLKSTYTDALQEQAIKKTNRIHTSYGIANTLTGRLSSNDPNLQNIPIRTENGKKIRKAFISEQNTKLISFDYSQIELRLAAEISKDKNFINAFLNSEDIHSSTAKDIFNVADKDLNSDLRRKAKAINFGILYGISPYGLAKQLKISNSEAKLYIENYFQKYPKIKEYMNYQIQFAKSSNFVSTIFGRRCNIKGINDKNFNVRGFAERQAINAPIQGSAADIIKLAMIQIHKKIISKEIPAKMLLQVHDELIFEVNEKDINESSIIIKKIMENAHLQYKDFTVPLTVDYGIGNTWGESH